MPFLTPIFRPPGPLGSGRYGVIRKAVCRRTGRSVAVKSIAKSSADRDPYIALEIEHLRALSALDSVASLLEVFEDDDAVHLVLECASAKARRSENRSFLASSAPPRASVLFAGAPPPLHPLGGDREVLRAALRSAPAGCAAAGT